jgi:hypothetical protein
MKTHIVFVGLVAAQITCFAQDKPDENKKRTWCAAHIREVAPDGKDKRLELELVSQDYLHLVGNFVLARQIEGPVPQLVIQGRFDKHGEFTANVCLEVSDQKDGDWKLIESSFSDKVDVTLTGAPHIDQLFVSVQLDAFQPYIGKFKFCRVSLQTGESDIFPMVWLTEKGPR